MTRAEDQDRAMLTTLSAAMAAQQHFVRIYDMMFVQLMFFGTPERSPLQS